MKLITKRIVAYTTTQTREKMFAKAYEYNIADNINGYAEDIVWANWASEEQINEYLAETGEMRRNCNYIVVDTACENASGAIYSNDLWAVIPINEFSARQARQIANALNNGVHCFDLCYAN